MALASVPWLRIVIVCYFVLLVAALLTVMRDIIAGVRPELRYGSIRSRVGRLLFAVVSYAALVWILVTAWGAA